MHPHQRTKSTEKIDYFVRWARNEIYSAEIANRRYLEKLYIFSKISKVETLIAIFSQLKLKGTEKDLVKKDIFRSKLKRIFLMYQILVRILNSYA